MDLSENSESAAPERVNEAKEKTKWPGRAYLALVFGIAGMSLTGSLSTAALGVGVYGTFIAFKSAFCERLSFPEAFSCAIITSLLFMSTATDIQKACEMIKSPVTAAQNSLFQKAGNEMYDGHDGPLTFCEDIRKFAPFGYEGPVIGQECITLELVKREGTNFMATAIFKSDGKRILRGFTREPERDRSANYVSAIGLKPVQ